LAVAVDDLERSHMTYRHISLGPISGSLGAIVEGPDLSQPLAPEMYAEIKQALLEYLVIFFRDQEITPARQIAFGRLFGELHIHPFIPSLAGHPEVIHLKARSGDQET